MTLSLSRMEFAVKSSKDSAQSPACKRNALPAATSASARFSRSASPANTSGGKAFSCSRAAAAAAGSGHSGSWVAGYLRHESGAQPPPRGEGSWVAVDCVETRPVGSGAACGSMATSLEAPRRPQSPAPEVGRHTERPDLHQHWDRVEASTLVG